MNVPKSLIRSLYDLQSMRIQIGNRIVAEIKVRLGQIPGTTEESLTPEGKQYIKEVRAEFKRIADAFVLHKASDYVKVDYESYHIITDMVMLIFVQQYEDQIENEEKTVKLIKKVIEAHPMWDHFLKDTKGIGPLMSAVCLSELDIAKADTISKFWAYAGYDVVTTTNNAGELVGKGRGRYKEHLVDKPYIDKDGNDATKKSITFNPFLKTKLHVLAECFIKIKTCKYRIVYDDYKNRIENMPAHQEKTKGHRHSMAIRYMIKMFLKDLWIAWRELEGLEVTASYHEDKLGHKHHEKGVSS